MLYNQNRGRIWPLNLKINGFKGLKNQQDSPAGLPGGLVLVRNYLTTSEEQTSKTKIAEIFFGDFADPAGSAIWAPSVLQSNRPKSKTPKAMLAMAMK